MTERAFVLAPLVELEPELTDPITKQPYRDILRRGSFELLEIVSAIDDLKNED
jgi:7,8-dihydro-6-hydroxymethylpterin-pyrophosphokinase